MSLTQYREKYNHMKKETVLYHLCLRIAGFPELLCSIPLVTVGQKKRLFCTVELRIIELELFSWTPAKYIDNKTKP